MASTLNAKSTGVGGIDATGDTSGILALQTGGVTALTIDTSQNVGIGTASPGYKLDIASGVPLRVSGTAGNAAGFEFCGNGNTYGTTSMFVGQGGASTAFIYQRANEAMTFGTNNIERMRITSAGNVGIGTSSPTAKLEVSSSVDTEIYTVATANTVGASVGGIKFYSRAPSNNWASGMDCYVTAGSPGVDYTDLRFYTTASGAGATERMRIDSTGNVGIGASTITSLSPNYTTVQLQGSSGSGITWFVGSTRYAYSYVDSGGFITQTSNATPLVLGTNGSERMRIDSSGHVIVNSASLPPSNSPSFSVLQLINEWTSMFWASSSTAAQNYGITVRYTAASPNTTTNPFYECKDSTALRGEIRSNGGLANYSANNVNLSDAREKINVELAGSYLDKICAIPVKTFNYIDQNMEDDPGLTLGVIAQDVQKIAPELVMESNWGTDDEPKNRLAIYQTDLQYALMKCIQEQQTIINELKARIETLENK